jgi:RNA polymerase sigma-70 factor (ECF subfamily)
MDEHRLESDEMLVAEVLSGDQQAFVRLVEQYQGLVSHLVFRIVQDSNDQEEVCQDVFVKVHKQLGTFQFRSKLSTWISRIAYNTAISHINKRKLETVEYDLEEVAPESGPAEEMSEMQLKTFIHDKMKLLTTVEKSVLTLYHLEEMLVSDISQVMMRPEGTIKSDLYRARNKLRKMMRIEEHKWMTN